MAYDKIQAAAAADFIRQQAPQRPSVGLLIGTGLGESTGAIDASAVLEYADIPHFPVSTVRGHAGRLIAGTMGAHPVVAFQGRFHLYEGYRPEAVVFPVRVMQELGVGTLIITNAAGGLNARFSAGQIMVIRDHINLTGANPLVGPNQDHWGIRFPDMTAAYDRALSDAALRAGEAAGIDLQQGVYAGLRGPSLETPAEVRFLKTIGCDAVGFSTVQEVIAGVHAGMRIVGLSTLTNINDPDRPQPATLEEIIETANRAAPALETVIGQVVAAMDG